MRHLLQSLRDRGFESTYSCDEQRLNYESLQEMMNEGSSFDLISYNFYYKELEDAQRLSIVRAETHHNNFDLPLTAWLSYDQFKSMGVKLAATSELEPFSSVLFTNDRLGKSVIAERFASNIESEIWIGNSDCYVHYPVRKNMLVVFGGNERYKLGLTENAEATKTP